MYNVLVYYCIFYILETKKGDKVKGRPDREHNSNSTGSIYVTETGRVYPVVLRKRKSTTKI